MRISDWSSDVCSSDLNEFRNVQGHFPILFRREPGQGDFVALALFGFENGKNLFLDGARWDARYRPWSLAIQPFLIGRPESGDGPGQVHIDLGHPRIAEGGEGMRVFDEDGRSEEHTSELQSLMRISYAVFCLKKKKTAKPIRYAESNTSKSQSSHISDT